MSKKKISIFVIILGILLCGIGLVLMLLSDKEEPVKPKEPTVSGDEFIESLNPNDDLVQGLYYMTKGTWYADLVDNSYYYYKSDKLLTSEFEKNHVFNIVFERVYKKGLLSSDLTVKEEVIKAEFEEVFGTYVSYSKIDTFNNGCYYIGFDSNTNEYIYMMTNGCVPWARVFSEATAAYRYENRIVIEESVLFTDGFDYFYDVDLTNKSSSTIIDVNDSNIAKYNYTFMYDKQLDKYYFYSIEKVK